MKDLQQDSVQPSLRLHDIAVTALIILAFALPFELVDVWLTLGPIRFTNLELLSIATLLLAWASFFQEWRVSPDSLRWPIPRAWRWLWLWFTVALIVSALLAPAFQLSALKASGRLLHGLILGLTAGALLRSHREVMKVCLGLVAGGLLSLLMGLAEMWSGVIFPWLNYFRNVPTTVGPYMRLTASFNHANQAAIFVEATLPLLVAFIWLAWQRRRRWLTLLLSLLGLLYLQAAFLTFSRASFVTIFISTLLVALLLAWGRPPRRRQAAIWAGLAAAVILLIGANALISPVFRLRLSSEGDNEWYNARFQVPETLTAAAGDTISVTVTVINDGYLTWSSHPPNPISLGGRWYRRFDNHQLDREIRWGLPVTIPPGDEATFAISLKVPDWPGAYRLAWDLVQEDVIWFSYKNGIQTDTAVTVHDNPTGDRTTERRVEQVSEGFRPAPVYVPPIPGRRVLWQVAATQFGQRPLLGIGLDNFRLTYGRVLGWESWNDTIHTNNWYIEMLVSLGLLGSIPFLAWLFLLGRQVVYQLRQFQTPAWRVAVAAGLIAYAVHGLLDYFLTFNPTGLLFWLLVGIWVSQPIGEL